ncbi:hypothetical protein Zmor_021756 [Zophobas morio]|uniref:Uncharacterized protein n=1 Tax=Zophobas morio TaxID=2755281 RepID=A0AA38MAR4_9CUCU|nr:hypothetical protein Zmor_021756 [Zophobas morio]
MNGLGLRTKKVIDKNSAKQRQGRVMYKLLALNGRELVYDEFFQIRVCRYGNALWCARTFTSVVQHLQDHGTFNLKLTIVAVIGQKEYCNLKNKFWNATKKSATSALADLQLKLEFHSLLFIVH